MTSGKQIKAARMLAEWHAEDLAEKVGMSREAIANIELGKVVPRPATIKKIVSVFQDAGIEFIGDRGVAKVRDNYRMLEGTDCYLRLLNDVHLTLRGKPNAEALFICVDDAVSSAEVRNVNNHIRDAGIRCRYLCSDKATRFDFPLADYKVIPDNFYTNSVMVVYENNVAMLRGANDAVMIVSDEEQAAMVRGLFEMIWLQSPSPQVPQGPLHV